VDELGGAAGVGVEPALEGVALVGVVEGGGAEGGGVEGGFVEGDGDGGAGVRKMGGLLGLGWRLGGGGGG
jgi:hypothetical protein